MRYRELILEYSRDITTQKLGQRIFTKLGQDESNYYAQCLGMAAQERNPTLPLKERAIKRMCDLVLLYCEQADPTPTKSYVQWIVNRWLSGGIQRVEDIRSTVADALADYDEIKRSGYFRRTDDPVMKKAGDINTLRSLFDLRAVVRSVPQEDKMSGAAQDKKHVAEMMAQATLLVDTSDCRVVVPHTEAASCFFGRHTQWCTAARTNNMFDDYNRRGDIFIVLDKKQNTRWQFHIQSGSFMDENDQEMSANAWVAVPKEALEGWIYEDAFNELGPADRYTMEEIMAMDVRPFSQLAEFRFNQVINLDEEEY